MVPVRTVRVIWFALLMAVGVYGMIIFVIKPLGGEVDRPFTDPLVLVLHVVGVIEFTLAYVVSSMIMRSGAQRQPAAPTNPNQDEFMSQRLFRALIIRWALFECCAVFGLLAGFISSDPRLFLPLGGLGVAGMLLNYPGDTFVRERANVV